MEIKNKLWLYAFKKGADDMEIGKFGFPLGAKRNGSKVTPAEALYYLGLSNIIMGMCDGEPAPKSFEASDYLYTFAPCDNIMWSVCGKDGYRIGTEEAYLKNVKSTHNNICAGFIGDIFGKYRNEEEPKRTELAKELISEMRKNTEDIPLYVSCYAHELDIISDKLLEKTDGIVFWIEDSDEIPFVHEYFEKIEERFPSHKKMLGVSLFDFKNYRPVPLQLLDFILGYGVNVISTGRADGMVFSSNTVMGVGFETDSYLREWIKNNGSKKIEGKR